MRGYMNPYPQYDYMQQPRYNYYEQQQTEGSEMYPPQQYGYPPQQYHYYGHYGYNQMPYQAYSSYPPTYGILFINP
jgi:hypothetical protein